MSSGRPILMVRVSEETRREVYSRAYELGICISDLLRMGIRRYLNELTAIHEKERKRSNSTQKASVRIAMEEEQVVEAERSE